MAIVSTSTNVFPVIPQNPLTAQQIVGSLKGQLILLDELKRDWVAKRIENLVSKILESPEHAQGKSITDKNIIVQMSTKGTSLKIIFQIDDLNILGGGTFKQVYPAQCFKVPLSILDITYAPKAFLQQNPDKVTNSLNPPPEITRGNKFLERIQEHIAAKKYQNIALVDPFKSIKPDARGATNQGKAIQTWYSSQIDIAYQKGDIPIELAFFPNTKKFFFENFLTAMIDVVRLLEVMHEIGIVHRDIRPHNILVGIEKDLARGLLTDFDLTCNAGCRVTSSWYYFWDRLAREGSITPFVDTYGIAISLECVLFKELYQKKLRQYDEELRYRDKFRNTIKDTLKLHSTHVNNLKSIHKNNKLSIKEKFESARPLRIFFETSLKENLKIYFDNIDFKKVMQTYGFPMSMKTTLKAIYKTKINQLCPHVPEPSNAKELFQLTIERLNQETKSVSLREAEKGAMEAIFELITEVINKNQVFYKTVTNDTELYNDLFKNRNSTNTILERLNKLEGIYMSISHVRQRLEAILSEFRNKI